LWSGGEGSGANPAFLRTPIFLSHGTEDRLATADETEALINNLHRSGFTSVRAESYEGGHEFNARELSCALEWFRTATPR
jgi:predicted esterase